MPMTKKNGKPKKSELPSTLKKSGKKAQRTDVEVIETTGTDSRPAVTFLHPKEYEAMQHELVGELSAFLSQPGNVRAKLKSTAITRSVPWQDQISQNPQKMLKPISPSKDPAFVNA